MFFSQPQWPENLSGLACMQLKENHLIKTSLSSCNVVITLLKSGE